LKLDIIFLQQLCTSDSQFLIEKFAKTHSLCYRQKRYGKTSICTFLKHTYRCENKENVRDLWGITCLSERSPIHGVQLVNVDMNGNGENLTQFWDAISELDQNLLSGGNFGRNITVTDLPKGIYIDNQNSLKPTTDFFFYSTLI